MLDILLHLSLAYFPFTDARTGTYETLLYFIGTRRDFTSS